MALNIFSVVPEIEAAQIKESEMTEAAWEASAWSCGHCTTFGDDFQSREAIVEHVQTQYVSRNLLETLLNFFLLLFSFS